MPLIAAWPPRSASVLALACAGVQCTQEVRVVGRSVAAAGGATATAEGEPAAGGAMSGEAPAPGATAGGAGGPVLGEFSPPRLIAELSLPDADEAEPTLTADGLEIFFKSSRLEGRGQLFVARRERRSDYWSAAELVPELASPTGNSYSPELSLDGMSLWFVSDRPGGLGGTDVYFTRRSSRTSAWSAPVLVLELSSVNCDIDPGPLPERNQFIVSSCDELGHNHLFLSTRSNTTAPWQPPAFLPELNTMAKEGDPMFVAAGLTLYFATTRDSPNGDDRADIWRTTRASLDAAFEPPVPVAELNILEVDDQDPWLSQDERHIVFTSTRERAPRELYEAFR